MTEAQLQNSAADYLRLVGVNFHHSPNEGVHKIQYRVKQKRAGMLPGFPDLLLMFPSRPPHFIELKTAKGRLTKNQMNFQQFCAENGYPFAVCRSLEDVQKIVEEWR